MQVVVLVTNAFDEWFATLTSRQRKECLTAVRFLRELGFLLEFPYSSAIKGTPFPLRELRPSRGASPLRLIYAFDRRRQAVVLIGGDKGADKRMYERLIPVAEALWQEHLKQLEEEDQEDDST